MRTYFDAAMEVSTGFKRLKPYSNKNQTTVVGLFSKVNDPDVVVVYVPGGVKPLGLDATHPTTLQPGGFTWRWLPLWLNRGVAVATVDFPKKFKKEMPPTERVKKERIAALNEIDR